MACLYSLCCILWPIFHACLIALIPCSLAPLSLGDSAVNWSLPYCVRREKRLALFPVHLTCHSARAITPTLQGCLPLFKFLIQFELLSYSSVSDSPYGQPLFLFAVWCLRSCSAAGCKADNVPCLVLASGKFAAS